MTTRDRLVLMAVIAIVVLGGGWLMLVSPERHKAADLQGQVASAQQQLQSARAEAASARNAEAQYTTAYTSMVSLGKAVPPTQEVPALVYQIDAATGGHRIEFNSINSGATSGSGSGSSSSSTAAAAAATPAAFTPLPFTFVFKGSYYGLYHLIEQINGFAQRTAAGGVHVSGRLLTIQSADVTLEQKGGGTSSSQGGELTATLTATAYVLPTSQGLTGGATAAGPAGVGAGSSASSPTTPAVARVTP
jgi:Type II secretion system (T2SS), protein M